MSKYRSDKFAGASGTGLGYSTKKEFTPDMDLRTVGYWDATRADKRTVVMGDNSIPKLTKLSGVIGPDLTTVTTGSAPASQDAAGNLGIAWRSDSLNQGIQRMLIPGGVMTEAKESIIGVVVRQQNVVATGGEKLLEFSCDGTSEGITFKLDFAPYGAPNNYVFRVNAPANGVSGYQLVPNFTLGQTNCVLVHMTNGLFKVRANGVEVASTSYTKSDALLPLVGAGAIGASFDGASWGLSRQTNTLLTHLLLASTSQIPSSRVGLVDKERDRNSAEYWEAALMYAAGIQDLLPANHSFRAVRPITTWMGVRT